MSSPATIFRQFLIDSDLGTEDGEWPVFASFMPDEADNAICVYDDGGVPDGRIMASGEKIVHPTILVHVTGPDYDTAWDKAEAIALAMDAVRRTVVVISSEVAYTFHNVSRTGPPNSLGVQGEGDRRRHVIAVSAAVTLTLN